MNSTLKPKIDLKETLSEVFLVRMCSVIYSNNPTASEDPPYDMRRSTNQCKIVQFNTFYQ